MQPRAIVDDNVAADHRLPGEQVPGAGAVLSTVDRIDVRCSTGGDDHHLRVLPLHVVATGEGVRAKLYPQPGDLAYTPVDHRSKVSTPATGRSDQQLSTGLTRCFEKDHLMAALCRHPCGFKPGRTTTDNHDPATRLVGRRDNLRQMQFATGRWIVQAGRPIGRHAVRRPNTGADALFLPGA